MATSDDTCTKQRLPAPRRIPQSPTAAAAALLLLLLLLLVLFLSPIRMQRTMKARERTRDEREIEAIRKRQRNTTLLGIEPVTC